MTDVPIPSRAYADRPGMLTRYPWASFAWGPVMAGVVTAIAIQLLFTVLGMAIGITATDAADGADAGTVTAVAGAWWLITGTIALLIGGMVLGRLWPDGAGVPLHIHALTMWGAVALFGFLVIWSGAGMVSQAASPLAAAAAQTGVEANELPIIGQTQTEPGAAADRTVTNPAAVREARSGAQAASWWSVVGLILGIAASLVGASMAARAADVRREPVPAY